MKSINQQIKDYLKETGVKQEYIAKQIGITQGTLSQKLSNGDDIKYSLLLKISNILKVDIIDIIKYPDKYVPETESCSSCKEKDLIIKNLNDYIEVLKNNKNRK